MRYSSIKDTSVENKVKARFKVGYARDTNEISNESMCMGVDSFSSAVVLINQGHLGRKQG